MAIPGAIDHQRRGTVNRDMDTEVWFIYTYTKSVTYIPFTNCE